jgi:hypothetical protein
MHVHALDTCCVHTYPGCLVHSRCTLSIRRYTRAHMMPPKTPHPRRAHTHRVPRAGSMHMCAPSMCMQDTSPSMCTCTQDTSCWVDAYARHLTLGQHICKTPVSRPAQSTPMRVPAPAPSFAGAAEEKFSSAPNAFASFQIVLKRYHTMSGASHWVEAYTIHLALG